MRARKNANGAWRDRTGIAHDFSIPKAEEPSEGQIKAAKNIAEAYGINLPEVFTKKAYTQFISNHRRRG